MIPLCRATRFIPLLLFVRATTLDMAQKVSCQGTKSSSREMGQLTSGLFPTFEREFERQSKVQLCFEQSEALLR
jgi:hypothetical protein